MKDTWGFAPCADHVSLLRMPEFDRAYQIATDCEHCSTDANDDEAGFYEHTDRVQELAIDEPPC